jgi:hypothetical protein
MKVKFPREMSSPRGVVAFSFLSAFDWLKSKLSSYLRTTPESAPQSQRLVTPSASRKYTHAKRIVFF